MIRHVKPGGLDEVAGASNLPIAARDARAFLGGVGDHQGVTLVTHQSVEA